MGPDLQAGKLAWGGQGMCSEPSRPMWQSLDSSPLSVLALELHPESRPSGCPAHRPRLAFGMHPHPAPRALEGAVWAMRLLHLLAHFPASDTPIQPEG